MLKRVTLFLMTNLAVVFVLTIVANILARLFDVNLRGDSLPSLIILASLFGFGGAFISLMMSKGMAKRATGARIIDQPVNETERWLINTIAEFAQKANINMPEVGIYEGEPNAFATGPSRNNSLVCVSTGLMNAMTKDEVKAVLGHEVAHVANGDMVTLTLIQGIVNTFVIFISRLIANMVTSGGDRNRGAGTYLIVVLVCQVLFGVLASIIVNYFSRQREFRADAGSSHLMGNPKSMIAALKKLKMLQAGQLPDSMAALGISDKPSTFMSLFSTHPPLDQRISALEEQSGFIS